MTVFFTLTIPRQFSEPNRDQSCLTPVSSPRPQGIYLTVDGKTKPHLPASATPSITMRGPCEKSGRHGAPCSAEWADHVQGPRAADHVQGESKQTPQADVWGSPGSMLGGTVMKRNMNSSPILGGPCSRPRSPPVPPSQLGQGGDNQACT